MTTLKLFLGLAILFVAVSAKSKTCKKKIPKLKQCLKNGYRPQILENCLTQGQEMKGKKQKKCLEIEQAVAKKCKSFQCEQNGKEIGSKTIMCNLSSDFAQFLVEYGSNFRNTTHHFNFRCKIPHQRTQVLCPRSWTRQFYNLFCCCPRI